MESLFVKVDKAKRAQIRDLTASYFVDTSGSTAGKILRNEKSSAMSIAQVIAPKQIVAWNTRATILKGFDELNRSEGGTSPTCFGQYAAGLNCMVVYTDGQIDLAEMARFKTLMETTIGNIPIIIVFAVANLERTVQEMQKDVNMSIPETFLSLSNDVAILITAGEEHRVLMSKGCFNVLPAAELTAETLISDLPVFLPSDLLKIEIIGGIPSHVVKLKTMEAYIDINVLYTLDSFPVEVLDGLCDRTLIPKLNLGQLHSVLNRMNRKMMENPELDAVRNELFLVSSSAQAGSEQHLAVIAKYNEIRSRKNTTEDKVKLGLINKLLEYIGEYQKNTTNIVYGSNRANRATVFRMEELEVLGKCAQIDCPIMLSPGDGCILLKRPEKLNYVEEFTSDYAMEAPFEFGTWLVPLLTPGIFSSEVAVHMTEHPYTRERVLGFLPLSENPGVIMKHMSKLFGGNREMWHFVRGYIAMMVVGCQEIAWMNREAILPSIHALVSQYNATIDLKGGSTKVPLTEAFQHVLANFATCLRDRTYADVLAIVRIAKEVMPGFAFDEQRIVGMVTVVKEFLHLLDAHKRNENMRKYVMAVDDYEHYVAYTPGVKGLIAQILWYDQDGEYRLLKLQLAIDRALCDKKYGPSLKLAMNGSPFDESVLEIKAEEPTGVHAGGEPYFAFNLPEGLPETRCTYCGMTFETAKEKLAHLKTEFGVHFYNGHLACKSAVAELGKNAAEKDLFLNAKERLYRAYGDKRKALHTKRSKHRLLLFINKFKES